MVIFELVKLDLLLLNAPLLNAVLRFISQPNLPSDFRKLPTQLNFSTCLISIPFTVRLHVGELCFFDTVIEYVFFEFNDNTKDLSSSITVSKISKICWRSFCVSAIKVVSPAYVMLLPLRPFITPPCSSSISLNITSL